MSSYLFDLAGKKALVTGGGRGIGLAIAEGLVLHGARVHLCGRNEETLGAAREKLGLAVTSSTLDVADEQAVIALAERVKGELGGLDILVNNAGVDPHYASLDKTDTGEWHNIVRTNLDGVYYCCRHLGSLMIAQQAGCIINISSVGGQVALKRQVPYCASKGGVEQITRALAVDWAEHNIRVNAIGYGFIKTELTSAMTSHPHISGRLLARTPLGRFGEISEVAGAAVFLASPSASYVTGHTLMVDGGWCAA